MFNRENYLSTRSAIQHVVAVFFDLEKAYDTTWKHGIMKDLYDAGLRGRLPLFVQGFLQNRQFQIRLGSHISDVFDQEMGVPQGSILSVTLFALKINSNRQKCIPRCGMLSLRGRLPHMLSFQVCSHH